MNSDEDKNSQIALKSSDDHNSSKDADLGELTHYLAYQLRQAHLMAERKLKKLLGPQNVAYRQYSLLMLIERNPDLSQSELARIVDLDRSAMVALIDNLETHGWARRVKGPKDRRRYALQITPAGKKFIEKAHPLIQKHDALISRNLSKVEKQQLLDLLGQLLE